MGLEASSFADLVAATLKELGPYDTVSQIAQEKQRLEVLSRWFKNFKDSLESGYAIQRNLMVGDGTNGPARHVSITAPNNYNLADVLKQITVPWRHAETSWMVIRQHVLMNRRPSAIVNQIEAQRDYSMLKMHEEMERKAWGAAPSSSDTTSPWAVKYWVVQNATTGFYGGSPTGDGLIAGITLSGLPQAGQVFQNYSGTYSAITPGDGLAKLNTMHRKVGFISPVTMKEYTDGSGNMQRVYVNETTISGFEQLCMQNGDLSLTDIAKVDGLNLAFRRNPIIWIPYLDDDTNNPIYMLDHSSFKPVVLEGDDMFESRNQAPLNRNVEQYAVDLSYNYVCTNRRMNGVLYQV